MTKYSKIKKSTFAIIALSLILVAILTFGGTYAYFSDSAEAAGEVSIGTLQVEVNSGSPSLTLVGSPVVPNQDLMKDKPFNITFGSTDIKFCLRVTIEAKLATGDGISPDEENGEPNTTSCLELTGLGEKFKENTTDGNGKHTYYYVGGNGTPEPAKAKPVDATANKEDFTNLSISVKLSKDVGANGSTAYMGKQISVTITVEVLQADYLELDGGGASVADGGVEISTLDGKWDEFAAKAKS